MSTSIIKLVCLPMLILTIVLCNNIYGQDTPNSNKSEQLLDMKLQLLDSKMQLLDTKLELLESASVYKTNLKLQQLDSRLRSLEKSPKVIEIDDTTTVKSYKSSIKLNPFRLLEGTFQLSYEWAINDKFSIDIAGLGTYVSNGSGFGGGYAKEQETYYYNYTYDTYNSYNLSMITGWGVLVQAKNFLLTNYYSNLKAPVGLYAAPQVMYRRISLTGTESVWTNYNYSKTKITQNLDVLAGGVVLGVKFVFQKALCIDIYAGGVVRLSKYTDEKNCTKYKKWNNIDYSGVLPTIGINIGILN